MYASIVHLCLRQLREISQYRWIEHKVVELLHNLVQLVLCVLLKKVHIDIL